MAITNKNSDLLQAIAASQHIDSWKVGGDGNEVVFRVEQDIEVGDPTSGLRLYRTQQGSVALLLGSSGLKSTGFTYPITLTLGHEAYRMPDGTQVAENRTAYAPNIVLTADGYVNIQGVDLTAPFTSLIAGNVTITAWEANGQTIPIGAVLEGSLAFNQA